MIHKEQLNKLLQLVDAGILGPHDIQKYKLLNMEPIINNLKYQVEYDTVNDNISIIDNFENFETISKDVITIKEIVDSFNTKEDLRISKKIFTGDYKLEIDNFEVHLHPDNIYFGTFNPETLNGTSKIFNSDEILNLNLDNIPENLNPDLNNTIDFNIKEIWNYLKNPSETNLVPKKLVKDLYDLLDINSYNDIISRLTIIVNYKLYSILEEK